MQLFTKKAKLLVVLATFTIQWQSASSPHDLLHILVSGSNSVMPSATAVSHDYAVHVISLDQLFLQQ